MASLKAAPASPETERMMPMNDHQGSLKTYVGYIWIDDEPGIRLEVLAESPNDAVAAVEAEYGEGHALSLWNEEDASKPR